MSTQTIAPVRGEGISTPQILAETHESGNTQEFSPAAFSESLYSTIIENAEAPLRAAGNALDWLSTIQSIIRETVELGLSCPPADEYQERLALQRIRKLAEIATYIANDVGNVVDADREALADEHLPRLLAALPEGGTQ